MAKHSLSERIGAEIAACIIVGFRFFGVFLFLWGVNRYEELPIVSHLTLGMILAVYVDVIARSFLDTTSKGTP